MNILVIKKPKRHIPVKKKKKIKSMSKTSITNATKKSLERNKNI